MYIAVAHNLVLNTIKSIDILIASAFFFFSFVKVATAAMVRKRGVEIGNMDIHQEINRFEEVFTGRINKLEASLEKKLNTLLKKSE